jgi:hypothetical protein
VPNSEPNPTTADRPLKTAPTRMRRHWAHPAHICAGTGLTPPIICPGTGLTPPIICAGTGLPPVEVPSYPTGGGRRVRAAAADDARQGQALARTHMHQKGAAAPNPKAVETLNAETPLSGQSRPDTRYRPKPKQ